MKSARRLWLELSELEGRPEQPLSVVHTTSGEFLGQCGVLMPGSDWSEVEIYCAIRTKFWNRGFATEICRALLRAVFDDLRSTKVSALIDPLHKDSIALVGKLGFAPIGPIRRPGRRQDGHLLFELLRPGA